jgi:hypothetical protein
MRENARKKPPSAVSDLFPDAEDSGIPFSQRLETADAPASNNSEVEDRRVRQGRIPVNVGNTPADKDYAEANPRPRSPSDDDATPDAKPSQLSIDAGSGEIEKADAENLKKFVDDLYRNLWKNAP